MCPFSTFEIFRTVVRYLGLFQKSGRNTKFTPPSFGLPDLEPFLFFFQKFISTVGAKTWGEMLEDEHGQGPLVIPWQERQHRQMAADRQKGSYGHAR